VELAERGESAEGKACWWWWEEEVGERRVWRVERAAVWQSSERDGEEVVVMDVPALG
jgi:hypothetical protein